MRKIKEHMKVLLIMKFILLLLFCSCSNLKLEKSELVYYSHFEKADTVFWTGNDKLQFAEVDKSIYYYEALDSSARYNAPHFPIDSLDNYQIELAITGPDNEDSSFYGLIFGNLDIDDEFIELKLNNAGQYIIRSNELLDEGTYNEGLNKKLKKIKVLKKDLDAQFFIDEKEIFTYPIRKFSKFRAGPVTAYRSAIWMDFFKIEKVL